MFKKVPLIVILGSTGTGKTKLSLELAQKFGGEIISADSMQVYKGLDIVTAKATKSEQTQASHHLLDVAKPGILYSVVNFRDAALPIIENLISKNKIPIIVGGTNYYIESILWKILVNPPMIDGDVVFSSSSSSSAALKMYHNDGDDSGSSSMMNNDNDGVKKLKKRKIHKSSSSSTASSASSETPEIDLTMAKTSQELAAILKMNRIEMVQIDSEILHGHLKTIDPVTAARLHPNNQRKIIRALEVFINSGGESLSSILDVQRNAAGGCNLGGPLRYPHVILFWMKCEQEVLNQRLDARVDSMLALGLLTEIRQFHEDFVKPFTDADYTKGILQTIGLKEFVPYLEKYDKKQDELINEFIDKTSDKNDNQSSPDGMDDLKKCLDELKLVTRRYSKKQNKWILNRFLGNTNRQVPPLYKLDTTNPQNWQTDVYLPAEDIIQAYIEDRSPQMKAMERFQGPREGLNEEVSNICEVCQRTFVGEFQWKIHLKSNKHKKILARISKRKSISERK